MVEINLIRKINGIEIMKTRKSFRFQSILYVRNNECNEFKIYLIKNGKEIIKIVLTVCCHLELTIYCVRQTKIWDRYPISDFIALRYVQGRFYDDTLSSAGEIKKITFI